MKAIQLLMCLLMLMALTTSCTEDSSAEADQLHNQSYYQNDDTWDPNKSDGRDDPDDPWVGGD